MRSTKDIYTDLRDPARSLYRGHPGLRLPRAARAELRRERRLALWSGMLHGALGFIALGFLSAVIR